jgi:predicted component of type VI protein secretion system
MGMRIENATNAITAPIITIIIGSSSDGERADAHVDLRFVAVGDVEQHVFELARALADRHHVVHERRELAGLLERVGDALAFTNRVAGLVDDVDITELVITFLTMSIAVSSGTPT